MALLPLAPPAKRRRSRPLSGRARGVSRLLRRGRRLDASGAPLRGEPAGRARHSDRQALGRRMERRICARSQPDVRLGRALAGPALRVRHRSAAVGRQRAAREAVCLSSGLWRRPEPLPRLPEPIEHLRLRGGDPAIGSAAHRVARLVSAARERGRLQLRRSAHIPHQWPALAQRQPAARGSWRRTQADLQRSDRRPARHAGGRGIPRVPHRRRHLGGGAHARAPLRLAGLGRPLRARHLVLGGGRQHTPRRRPRGDLVLPHQRSGGPRSPLGGRERRYAPDVVPRRDAQRDAVGGDRRRVGRRQQHERALHRPVHEPRRRSHRARPARGLPDLRPDGGSDRRRRRGRRSPGRRADRRGAPPDDRSGAARRRRQRR